MIKTNMTNWEKIEKWGCDIIKQIDSEKTHEWIYDYVKKFMDMNLIKESINNNNSLTMDDIIMIWEPLLVTIWSREKYYKIKNTKMYNGYYINDILNTKIHPLYVTEPQISIIDHMHEMMIDLLEGKYNYEEMLSNLFIGFVENKFIDGFVSRDKDRYLSDYDYKYSDAAKLYNVLINYIFNLNKKEEKHVPKRPDFYDFNSVM